MTHVFVLTTAKKLLKALIMLKNDTSFDNCNIVDL